MENLEAGWQRRGTKGAVRPSLDLDMSLIVDNAGDKIFGIPSHSDEIWIYHPNSDTWTRKDQRVVGGQNHFRRISHYGDIIVMVYPNYNGLGTATYSMSEEKVLFETSPERYWVILLVAIILRCMNVRKMFRFRM